MDIYRVYEVSYGVLEEIAFVEGKENVKEYLESCNKWNKDSNIIYFAEKIKVEKWDKKERESRNRFPFLFLVY